jgi:orotate phosphoribosyltransferase
MMMPAHVTTRDELIQLLPPPRRGHFRLESGHHAELWLDLERLCLRPAHVRRFAAELARRLGGYQIDAVCGALNEGAFVALMVAAELDVEFSYAERFAPPPSRDALFEVQYRLPRVLRDAVRGKRVGVVNDVISAGSAVRGTIEDLKACGARPVVVGTLVTLGSSFGAWATAEDVAVESLESFPHNVWTPSECPLCAAGVALDE